MLVDRPAIAVLLLTLCGAGPATAQDRLPVLNVEPASHAYSARQPDPQRGFTSCMEQEQRARAELEKDWSQFASQDRQRCLNTTTQSGGKTPSYIEVLGCVTVARDARAFEKANPSDLDVSDGRRQ